MKKIILIFLLITAVASSENELYKKVIFLDGEVYFPKTTSEYIDSLLKDKSDESYAQLTEIYYNLGNNESMTKYFEAYMESNADYLEKSRLCHKIKEYGLEIKNILKYVENRSKNEKVYYQNYITKLIKENNLTESVNLGINKLDVLFSYINDDDGFEEYFYKNRWNREEKKKIVEILKDENIENRDKVFNIYKKIGNNYDVADYYYSKIASNYDYEAYGKYYRALEENGIEPLIRNEFETLHYLKYKNNTDEYERNSEEMKKKFLRNKEYKKLYTLYKITGNIEILTNISIVNEEFAYRYIKEISDNDVGKEKKEMLKLIEVFNKSYPESQYSEELFKIKMDYSEDSEEILNEINSQLVKRFDRDLLMKKVKIYLNMGKMAEAERTIAEHIFGKYPDFDLINMYIDILAEDNRGSELYEKLLKLQDKRYLFNYCEQNKQKVPKDLEEQAVKYYFDMGEYNPIYQYKDSLTYEQYKRVIENNMLVFVESANKKYPYEKEWMDKKKNENFYFDEEQRDFDIIYVKQILDKKIKSDAEIYYMAKYFYFVQDYTQSRYYLNQIISRYNFSEEMKNLKKKLEEN